MNETKIAEVNTLVRKNSRTELVRLCKEKNLSVSGTKHDMAVRLIGGLNEEKKVVLEPQVKKIIIRRDPSGRWEYEGLIFDDKTKNVVGRLEDGVVKPLQRQDIEKCKQYKFRYTLPQILDERLDASSRNAAHELSSDEEEGDLDDMEEDADT
jgi:hypothetical protein